MLNKILNPQGKTSPLQLLPALENTGKDVSQCTLNELLKAKVRLCAIYDSSFDALTMLGDDGFIDCNTAALTLFGCANVVEFCRHHPSDLSPAIQACGTDSRSLAQHYIYVTLKKGSCRFEWLHQRVDNGVIFHCEILLSSLKIDGKVVLQAVTHDLTSRKKAAALLANKEKKVEQLKLALYEQRLTQERNEALLVASKDRTENLAGTKAQFLANMSHEIRTPMTAIIGFSDLALLEKMPVIIYDYLQDISTAAKHLLTILNDILDVSKLEAEQIRLQLERFKLVDLRTTLYGLLTNTAQVKGLTLTIDIEVNVPDILIGDSLRLRQVLINLLGNAIKFTQQGSVTLTIKLQQLNAIEAQLLFSVIDTGIGISAEQQDKLFQPFSQVDDSFSRDFEGTGLGLTISQDLVQLMGSSIKLDSHVDLGSCFSFELALPLALSAIEAQVTPISSLNPEPLSDIRILVAEDDAFNQKIIHLVLKKLGANVMLANNGLEVLAALEQDRFDIVLMDLHMPSMNGYEATLAIRKMPHHAQLPVIAFSASVTEEEQRRCLAIGMNDFIAKPINKIALVATLERWLN